MLGSKVPSILLMALGYLFRVPFSSQLSILNGFLRWAKELHWKLTPVKEWLKWLRTWASMFNCLVPVLMLPVSSPDFEHILQPTSRRLGCLICASGVVTVVMGRAFVSTNNVPRLDSSFTYTHSVNPYSSLEHWVPFALLGLRNWGRARSCYPTSHNQSLREPGFQTR